MTRPDPEYIRLIGREVQTSVRLFTHPGTGRHITVIGTYHHGDAGYFARLNAVIDDLTTQGAIVLTEGSRLLPCDTTTATPEERDVLARLHHADDLGDLRTRELGWVHQIHALGYSDSWQIIDLDYLQIIRGMGVSLARGLARRKLAEVSDLNRMRLAQAVGMRTVATDRIVIKVSQLRHPMVEVLIDRRNTKVLDAAAATTRDVVLIWAVNHLPGLDTGLTTAGFVRTGDPHWHTVTHRPTIPNATWQLLTRRPAPAARSASRTP